MPAKVYSTPDYIQAPSLSIDNMDAYDAACEAYYQQTAEWARDNTNSTSDLVGQIIRFPVADGYAEYMVLDTRPLQLLHLETGDAYSASAVTMRGLRVADVKSMVERDRNLQAMFASQDDWFDGLAVGTTVHYHDGFGKFVRCEVKVGDEDNLRSHDGKVRNKDLIGKTVLSPVALVGNWTSPVSRNLQTGEAVYGYHAQAIIEQRGAWRPSESCVFEAPGYSARAGEADPANAQPVDLTPPALTAEQQAAIPAWQTVQRVHDALAFDATRGKSPQEIIESVQSALAA